VGGIAGISEDNFPGLTAAVIIENCYARGTVSGDGTPVTGLAQVRVGGIVGKNDGATDIRKSAALNSALSILGSDTTIQRVVGENDGGTLTNNVASTAMAISFSPSANADGEDGADTGASPAQTVYGTTLGWNFSNIWEMSGSYPVLK
jgi:hypothetical protein